MNATQPPLQHGQGQPHDLPPHPQPMIQFQPQQMRGPIMPPAPAGPFQPGTQPSLYPQHRQGPPPNQMMMVQPVSRMMAPNGIPPSAMIPAPIPFPNTARRQQMPPGYPHYIPNGPAPNHSLGHPSMFRPSPGDDLSKMRMRVGSGPTVPGPMGPLALSGGPLPGASHAMIPNNQFPTSHSLPPRQSLPSPARSPRSQPPHSAAQTPVYTGPGGYVPAGSMTPAAHTPRPQTAGPSYQHTPRLSMALDGIPDPSGLSQQIVDPSVAMEGLAGDAPADVVMQNPGPSHTPRPMSQTGSLSGAPTVREMSLARDSTHGHTPHPPHLSVSHSSKPYASSRVMALSADLSVEEPGKETDEYWRRIVSKHFASEAIMTISLPKAGPPEPSHLGHTGIAQMFKAICASGVSFMSFSIDGAREHYRQSPEGPSTFILYCAQARWRMHYFSGYMVELHGTLKVMCVLSQGRRAWRVQIQQFDLECVKDTTWLAKSAISGRFLGPMQRRSALPPGTVPGVGADAESNRYMRQGEVLVPTTPVTQYGLPVPAVWTMEMHGVLSDMASVMDYAALNRCGPQVAMEQIVSGAIPQLFPSIPHNFHPLYPPSYAGANQLGYPFPSQAPPLHQHLQTPQQQPLPFQHLLGPALPVGVGIGQMPPPPGPNDTAPRPMAPPANASGNNPEPGAPPISGPIPIARPTNAEPTPPQNTPKLVKRAPGSPSKADQRKRNEAGTPAGNETNSERGTGKRKAPTQQVGESDTPVQPKRQRRRK